MRLIRGIIRAVKVRYNTYCAPLVAQSLGVDLVRFGVVYLRFNYFARVLGRLKTFEGDPEVIGSKTIAHNVRSMMGDLAVNRSRLLVRPLSVIESLSASSKVLVIGPRTEGEILNLIAHGFKRGNIHGLDLISYSPWIEVGDMHQMPFEDNSWDAVILGWVIAYSQERKKAAQEIIRVARHGAIVAVGVEYNPLTEEEIKERYGYALNDKGRLTSTDEVLELFKPHVDRLYFVHDVIPERRDQIGAISVIFSIRK